MSEDKIYPVTESSAAKSYLNKDTFRQMYQQSIEAPEDFWAEQAGKLLHWHQPWKKVSCGDFAKADSKWFEGAKLNVAYNCIDRHLERRGEQTAIIWEGDEPDQDKKITYRELHQQVCKLANALKSRGVSKGD
ncbi:MAG: AMP-binding protein, partial [Gammaproteobacteria bacterium]|nr:AMP-binding protein [Gammaproteobacteria bacterium]